MGNGCTNAEKFLEKKSVSKNRKNPSLTMSQKGHLGQISSRIPHPSPMAGTTDRIQVRGARQHNLKGISVDIPTNKLVVVTGVSGSGKSSLVYDTLYAESHRQLLETFSSFQRTRIPTPAPPECDSLRNLPAAVMIKQQRLGGGWRSVVGTISGIYDLIRVLWSRCGTPRLNFSSYFSFNNPEGMCESCEGLGKTVHVDLERIFDKSKKIDEGAILFPDFPADGYFCRVIMHCGLFPVDKPLSEWNDEELKKLLYSPKIKLAKKEAVVSNFEGIIIGIKRRYLGSRDFDEESSRAQYFKIDSCESCDGARLNERARNVVLSGKKISDVVAMEINDLHSWLETELVAGDSDVGKQVIQRIKLRLGHLISLGLGYLFLDRQTNTLSGGESQRCKIAKQMDCDLTGLAFYMDEPSLSLHMRDVSALVNVLKGLKDRRNSVICVEHDPDFIAAADYVIELGVGAGKNGGKVLFQGSVDELKKTDLPTARALKARSVEYTKARRVPSKFFALPPSSHHNLKAVEAKVPVGVFTVVTGVAGSGKSTLIVDVFAPRVSKDAVIVDQRAIGRTSRSNVATYVGVFDAIRALFAKATGKKANMFSFNSSAGGGCCPKCSGKGEIAIEMSFLEEIVVVCEDCNGKRFNDDVLKLKVGGFSIADVLGMDVETAIKHYKKDQKITKLLNLLQEVGLGYLTLGQSLSTLSGGECQRLKLSAELKKGQIFILDEPTSGLSTQDVHVLLDLLDRLVCEGNTVVVIEHCLEVMARADWIIDMGPEGGKKGGEIICVGPPETIALCSDSVTGTFLKSAGISRLPVLPGENVEHVQIGDGKRERESKGKVPKGKRRKK